MKTRKHLHIERPSGWAGVKPGTLLLWGDSANHSSLSSSFVFLFSELVGVLYILFRGVTVVLSGWCSLIRLHCVYFHLFTISMVWGDLSFILFSFFLLFNHKIHLSILVSITKQFKLRISFRTIRCSRLRINCQSNTIHSFLLSCIWCRVILGIIQDRQK